MPGEERDWVRHLPLSARPRVDETGVTGDWRERLDELEAALPPGERPDAVVAAFARARRRRRVRVADLGAALLACYLADEALEVSPITSGAVALARTGTAPLPIRAVLRGRTLRATDAGWEFGIGPELAGTARELVLFLYGRGPVPSA